MLAIPYIEGEPPEQRMERINRCMAELHKQVDAELSKLEKPDMLVVRAMLARANAMSVPSFDAKVSLLEQSCEMMYQALMELRPEKNEAWAKAMTAVNGIAETIMKREFENLEGGGNGSQAVH